jgi:hypothetical protein
MYTVDLSIEYDDIQSNTMMTIKNITLKTVELEQPSSPSEIFIVTNVESTEIRAGNPFTMYVRIRNVGNEVVQDGFVTVSANTPFIYHNPSGTTSPGTISTGLIGIGNSTVATFEMMAGAGIDQGREYNCSIIITYVDSQGNQIYSTDDIKHLQLKVKYEGKTIEQLLKEEREAEEARIELEKSTLDMTLLYIAIIILIAVILFPIILKLTIFKGPRYPKPKYRELPLEREPPEQIEPPEQNGVQSPPPEEPAIEPTQQVQAPPPSPEPAPQPQNQQPPAFTGQPQPIQGPPAHSGQMYEQ